MLIYSHPSECSQEGFRVFGVQGTGPPLCDSRLALFLLLGLESLSPEP